MKALITIIIIAACALVSIMFGMQLIADCREAFGNLISELIRGMKIRMNWDLRMWYTASRDRFCNAK